MQQIEAPSASVAHARITPELRNQLEAVAQANDRSIAAEIRRAIAEHVEREQVDLELQELKEKAARFRPIGQD
jgi:predicted transcriptional regulator